jgi:nicotinamidase-related amidase
MEVENPCVLRSPSLLSRTESAVLVVDVQTKLLRLIPGFESVLMNIHRILDGATLFQIPVHGTEQYPKGLGSTEESLRSRLPEVPAKTRFSCLECADLIANLDQSARRKVVIVGIETHVCILQTALDLLAYGYEPYVVVDAVSARGATDHEIALRRMEGQGCILTTTESVLFEWCETASDPAFKQVSEIIRRKAADGSA